MRTSVGLQPESDAPVVTPLQRDQADVASDHRTLELVLDHAVGVAVAWKRLEITSESGESAGFPTALSEELSLILAARAVEDLKSFSPEELYCHREGN